MAMTLDELQSQLGGLKEYQPADEAALRQRAENVYKPQYEQDQLSLKDQLYTALATQGRSALANGMQRSSYNQAAKASIQGQGLRAQSQLAANYEGNVAQLLNNLIEGDKDRATAAGQQRDNLLLQLYQLGQAGSGGGSGSGYEYQQGTETAKPLTKDVDSVFGSLLPKVGTTSTGDKKLISLNPLYTRQLSAIKSKALNTIGSAITATTGIQTPIVSEKGIRENTLPKLYRSK